MGELLECIEVSIMISHTTKHMSTRYGLSSIKHESKCGDDRISLQGWDMQNSVVDTMCSNRVAYSYVVNMTTNKVSKLLNVSQIKIIK